MGGVMTAPRCVLPGQLYFVTRRCTQRQFLLRPDEETNQIFEFSLAVAAERSNIKPITWKAMSNHYHAVVYDPDGRIPEFIQYHHKLTASLLNEKWKRYENVWATEETCVTLLATEEDALEKIAYTLANAASANLVDSIAHWPGASSWRFLDGRPRIIRRPESPYFKKKGSVVPAEVELVVSQPPKSKAKESFTAWADLVRKKVRALEASAAKRRLETGERVKGRKMVLAAKHTDTPDTKREGNKLRPRVACGHKETRIELLKREKGFWIHHHAARVELLEGVHEPVFPEGTYRARRLARIRIGTRAPIDEKILMRHLTRIPSTE